MWTKASNTRARGGRMETLAARWLQARGLQLVARNLTFPGGELDLIMREDDTLVFVEVRYRKSSAHGSALESITPAKQQRLIRAATRYLQKFPQPASRFDVVALDGDEAAPDIQWIRHAFDAF
ncbi:YraN family protein [Larsenimonas rhizosphaerae]|uniref:UPF0102 protein OQ287_05870 n=1 Tax=Larsenimonas rhizosphaerae TaxID=2944682 RepID=A0AA42CXD7_9GAMM|nr:YraN family protein [Larsenimonas rhizosphaerae]MCX2523760.1 YraN family protein [Larsenimonas rhizosphaerae]